MIYFMQNGDKRFVKIGYAKSPPERMKDHQTAHYHALTWVWMAGDRRKDTQIKRHFAPNRKPGGGTEWFFVIPELQAMIDACTNPLTEDADPAHQTWARRIAELTAKQLNTTDNLFYDGRSRVIRSFRLLLHLALRRRAEKAREWFDGLTREEQCKLLSWSEYGGMEKIDHYFDGRARTLLSLVKPMP